VIEIVEDRLIERFVTHAAVERLADPVLHRFSGGNEMPSGPTALTQASIALEVNSADSSGRRNTIFVG
jgi:hypothetical protein